MSGGGKGVAAATVALYGAGGTITPVPVYQCRSSGCVSVPMDLGQPTDQVVATLYGTGILHNTGVANTVAEVGGARAVILYAGAQPQYPVSIR